MQRDIYKYRDGTRYIRTKKDSAEKAIKANPELKYFLVGSNTNSFHFHGGWHLAHWPQSLRSNRARLGYDYNLEMAYKQFAYYLEPELGRYPVYYVEQEIIWH